MAMKNQLNGASLLQQSWCGI